MRNLSLMDTIAAISITLLAVLTTIFTLLYFFRSPWWLNKIGKIYLVKTALISLVLLQGTLSIYFKSDYFGREWVRTIIYVGGGIAYVPMIIALYREQNRDRARIAKLKREAILAKYRTDRDAKAKAERERAGLGDKNLPSQSPNPD